MSKKSNKQITYFQQGDVLLFPIDSLPEGLENSKTKVVQEGEHTGHAHRLAEGEVFLDKKTNTKFLRLVEDTAISHEEHKTINLPAGNYQVGIVREYDHFNEEARQVAD